MEHRPFGATGMSVSVLGFGGSEIGYQGADQDTVTRLLNSALDAGLNVIDTAECYMNSEELIGHAVAHRRKDFWLFTKVGHEHGGKDDYSAASIARTIDRSLQRLQTDHLDLVQLHSCDEATLKKGECIEALQRAKAGGKTRFIGYSGDRAAARWAVESGRFDALQTSVSIADQQAIELTLPLARAKNMGVIAKRPIANAVWRFDTIKGDEYHAEYWRRMQTLAYPFVSDHAKAADVALRFTAFLDGVHTCIVGTKNPERWAENARTLARGPLAEAEGRTIRERWREVAKAEWVGQT
jgi:aryl-alcohol dehydrogenase-like predicted oxidoreductase